MRCQYRTFGSRRHGLQTVWHPSDKDSSLHARRRRPFRTWSDFVSRFRYQNKKRGRTPKRSKRNVRSYWVEVGLVILVAAIISPAFLRSIVKRLRRANRRLSRINQTKLPPNNHLRFRRGIKPPSRRRYFRHRMQSRLIHQAALGGFLAFHTPRWAWRQAD